MSYSLPELVDIAKLQMILDSLYAVAGIPSAIIDLEGNILTATGWQDICTKFHRANPVTEQRCKASDKYIIDHINDGTPSAVYRCPSGLVDTATPIIVNSKHLGNVFTGQLFLERPDIDFFEAQAREFGFDVPAYLEALARVPVISAEKLQQHLAFIVQFTEMLAESGLQRLCQLEIKEIMEVSEEKYRSFVENFQGIAFRGRIDFVPIFFHGAVEAITGYTENDFLTGTPRWDQIIHPEDLARLSNGTIEEVRTTSNYACEREYRIVRKDGEIRWVHELIQNICDASGTPVMVQGALYDISTRKWVEQALQRSEEFVKNVIDNIGEGLLVVNHDFSIAAANKAYCDAVNKPCEEVIGKRCYEMSHQRARPCSEEGEECPVLSTFMTGSPHSVVHTHKNAAGAAIYVEIRAYPMKDASGRINSVIELSNDITDKRRLEEQLLQAQKMEGIGQLAGGIAHDFNNILTAIIGYGNIMQMKLHDTQTLSSCTSKILASAERAARLTQGLLTFSRKQTADPKLIDLNSVIRKLKDLLIRVIGEDVELKAVLEKGELVVLADSTHLEQIIMNLAANARDAMPGGGILSIETARIKIGNNQSGSTILLSPGDYALLSVVDTGTGMDEKTKERIFEPFYTTKEVGKGTGLGLAIVYGLVKQYNWYIDIHSEPAGGTIFEIYLPLSASKPKVLQKTTPAIPDRGTETVLIVEDDAVVRELIREVLTEAGYTVLEAKDGEDALKVFAENRGKVRIVLLDVIMPKMNGKETYERLKEIDPSVRALFLSGYTAEIISRTGVSQEALHFIAKPVMPRELLGKLREVLNANV